MLRGGEVLKQWGFSIMCGSVRGSLWPRQLQKDFHPKQGAAAAYSLASRGVTEFSPCWLSWGINDHVHSVEFWGVGRAKVCWERKSSHSFGRFLHRHATSHWPSESLVGLFCFVAVSCCEAASLLKKVWPTHTGRVLTMSITWNLWKYCSLYMAGVRNMVGTCGPCSWDHPNSRHKCHLAMAEVSQSYTQGNLAMWRWPNTAGAPPASFPMAAWCQDRDITGCSITFPCPPCP